MMIKSSFVCVFCLLVCAACSTTPASRPLHVAETEGQCPIGRITALEVQGENARHQAFDMAETAARSAGHSHFIVLAQGGTETSYHMRIQTKNEPEGYGVYPVYTVSAITAPEYGL